jgi:hypothetical protein
MGLGVFWDRKLLNKGMETGKNQVSGLFLLAFKFSAAGENNLSGKRSMEE